METTQEKTGAKAVDCEEFTNIRDCVFAFETVRVLLQSLGLEGVCESNDDNVAVSFTLGLGNFQLVSTDGNEKYYSTEQGEPLPFDLASDKSLRFVQGSSRDEYLLKIVFGLYLEVADEPEALIYISFEESCAADETDDILIKFQNSQWELGSCIDTLFGDQSGLHHSLLNSLGLRTDRKNDEKSASTIGAFAAVRIMADFMLEIKGRAEVSASQESVTV